MSALHTPATETAPALPQAPRTRRRRTVLVVLAALVAVALSLTVGVNAAASALGAHEHGSLDIRIDGDTVDLDQPRFHELHPEFHVHPGHGNLWHHHPENPTGMFGFEAMTLAEGLEAVGIELTADALSFDGAVHPLTELGASVTVQVDGAQVNPDAHVLADGDAITVEVVTGG